ARALRSGRAEVAGEISAEEMAAIAADPEHLRLARALEYTSYLVVPLVARDRTVGAISLVSSGSGRRYAAEDVPFVEDLARRAARCARRRADHAGVGAAREGGAGAVPLGARGPAPRARPGHRRSRARRRAGAALQRRRHAAGARLRGPVGPGARERAPLRRS